MKNYELIDKTTRSIKKFIAKANESGFTYGSRYFETLAEKGMRRCQLVKELGISNESVDVLVFKLRIKLVGQRDHYKIKYVPGVTPNDETKKEIKFIDDLFKRKPNAIKGLALGYKEPREWGNVDQAIVMKHINNLIPKEERC
jgi:hypothetical protein